MNKKIKFLSVMFLLLFARGCDFYSTSLWIFQEGGLEHETNPLTQIFGVGWNGLVMVNVIVITLISYCFYIYTFKYNVVLSLSPSPPNPKRNRKSKPEKSKEQSTTRLPHNSLLINIQLSNLVFLVSGKFRVNKYPIYEFLQSC